MSDRTDNKEHSSKAKSCLLFALAGFVLVFAIVAVFIYNNRPPNIHIPTPKMPKDNGWDYFVRAGEMIKDKFKGPLSDPVRRESEWTAGEIGRYLDLNKPALVEGKEGLKKPYLHPALRKDDDFLPHAHAHVQIIQLARLVASEALYYERLGKLGKAAESLLDCQELGVTVPRGGDLMAANAGQACESIAMRQLSTVIHRLDRQQLEATARRLEKLARKRTSFAEIVREQGRTGSVELMKWLGHPESGRQLADPRAWLEANDFDGSDWGKPVSARRVWRNARFAMGNKRKMVNQTREFFEEYAAEQTGTYKDKPRLRACPSLYAEVYVDLLEWSRVSCHTTTARFTVLQTEVALRRYRFDHGSYPQNLAAVVPEYLKKVPVDPFGLGKPLKYKQLNGGRDFLLYSLGPDLKDDGGTPGSRQNGFANGDIVAGKL